MASISPDFETLILRPPSKLEETVLDQHPLIAACFFHPDDPRHLEFKDVRTAIFEEEELAAVSRFGI